MYIYIYICLFDCKCNNLNRLGENITTNRKKHNKQKNNSKKNKQQHRYRISSPRTSANKSHKIFAEVRGLDILYFLLFFFELLYVLFSFFFFFSFFSSCFRLVFSSFCIYNRTHTYNNIKQNINNLKKNINKQKQQKNNRNLPAGT